MLSHWRLRKVLLSVFLNLSQKFPAVLILLMGDFLIYVLFYLIYDCVVFILLLLAHLAQIIFDLFLPLTVLSGRSELFRLLGIRRVTLLHFIEKINAIVVWWGNRVDDCCIFILCWPGRVHLKGSRCQGSKSVSSFVKRHLSRTKWDSFEAWRAHCQRHTCRGPTSEQTWCRKGRPPSEIVTIGFSLAWAVLSDLWLSIHSSH